MHSGDTLMSENHITLLRMSSEDVKGLVMQLNRLDELVIFIYLNVYLGHFLSGLYQLEGRLKPLLNLGLIMNSLPHSL